MLLQIYKQNAVMSRENVFFLVRWKAGETRCSPPFIAIKYQDNNY